MALELQMTKNPKTKAEKKPKVTKLKAGRISEVQRTILLFLLLAVAIGTLLYIQNNVDSNFVDTL